MDKLVLPAFLIENLPNDAHPDLILADINRLLRAVKGTVNVDHLQATFYRFPLENGGTKRFVKIRDVDMTWGQVKQALNSYKRIQKNAFKVSPDFGIARNIVGGNFHKALSGHALLFFQDMFMFPRKGLHELWNPDLYPELDIDNQSNRINITQVQDPDLALLGQAGRTLSWRMSRNAKFLSAEFITFLDKLQAISVIHKNSQFSPTAVIEGVTIDRQGGLGPDGALIDFSLFDQTFVPFSEFDPEVLPPYPFDSCYRKCYKCDYKGILVPYGITTCGLYIAAICNTCEYLSDPENPLVQKVAVNCFGEDFTRVRLGVNTLRNFTEQNQALHVVHTPLQFRYESAKQARDIICTLVGHEASYDRQVFKLANSRGGVLTQWQLIEVLEPTVEGEPEPGNGSLYLVTVRVTRTDVWAPDNVHRFHHVTCSFRGTPPGWEHEIIMERRGKVCAITATNTGNYVLVKMRVKGLNNFEFRRCYIRLAPSCPIQENVSLNSVMSHWVKKPNSTKFQLLNGLLLGQADLGLDRFQLPLYKCDWLNKDQADAFELCRQMKIVGIQGPPGTGKTSTAITFLMHAAVNEEGLMIAAARSNVAADKLADDILKYKARFPAEFGHLKMIRMASVKREQVFFDKLPQFEVMFGDENGKYLHGEILYDSEFWNDPYKKEIFEKIDREGMNGITTKEMQNVQQHISRHSYRILKEMNIVVTTLSTLSDNRLAGLLGISLSEEDSADLEDDCDVCRTDLRVNTILLDEAGVIPFPMMIPVLLFNPKRILLFGDNDQLPPQINCPSVEAACLNMSTMTYAKYGLSVRDGRTWHMLKTQYRMHPDICKIVSHMTYRDKLICPDYVTEREESDEIQALIQQVTRAVPQAQTSRVVVFDYKGIEKSKDTGSKENPLEATVVNELVAKLMNEGVPVSSIIVLTFYDAQRKLIEEKLRHYQANNSAVRVCNIDAFQGQESDVVILSMVRGNDYGEIGFCKSPNRLNVMISRARYFQFIVGNMATFFKKPENHIYRLRNSLRKVQWVNVGKGGEF